MRLLNGFLIIKMIRRKRLGKDSISIKHTLTAPDTIYMSALSVLTEGDYISSSVKGNPLVRDAKGPYGLL